MLKTVSNSEHDGLSTLVKEVTLAITYLSFLGDQVYDGDPADLASGQLASSDVWMMQVLFASLLVTEDGVSCGRREP